MPTRHCVSEFADPDVGTYEFGRSINPKLANEIFNLVECDTPSQKRGNFTKTLRKKYNPL